MNVRSRQPRGSGAVRRWRAVPAAIKDAAAAVLLTIGAQAELLLADAVVGSMALQRVSFAAMTVSVAWRRTHPLVAAALVSVGLGVQTLAGAADVVSGFIALLVVMYSVPSYAGLRIAVAGGLFVLIAVFVYPLVNDSSFDEEIGNLVIFGGAWALGRMVQARATRAVEAENHAREIERDHDETMRAAIADERERIARELHDIVAHGVSMMVLHSGAARQNLERDPAQVRELLLNVEQTGRGALADMHRLLGLLRRSGDDLAFTPPLTLEELQSLIEEVRKTGLAVSCRVEGTASPLPAGVEVSAYRIVQEALTNTIRHANATTADVVLRYDGEALEVVVVDDGTATATTAPSVSGGHGLVGMRERVELFGGSLSAGRAPAGGWMISARLPIGSTT